MSTPLTDAAIRSILQTGPHYRVNADFARSLELDNRAMRSILLRIHSARVAMDKDAVARSLEDVDRFCGEENTN